MTNPLSLADMPPLTLSAGATITVEALDPATGAPVAGVTISSVTLYGVNVTDDLTSTLPELGPPSYTVESLNGPTADA